MNNLKLTKYIELVLSLPKTCIFNFRAFDFGTDSK